MKTDWSRFMCFPSTTPVQGVRMAHAHGFHEFIICTNSHGTQYVGSLGVPHRRGNVFCFPAGMTHYSSGAPSAPARAYVIWLPDSMFQPDSYGDGEIYLALQRALRLARAGRNPLPLKNKTEKRILSLAGEMVKEFLEGKTGSQAATRVNLQHIFLQLIRDPGVGAEPPKARPPRHEEQMAKVMRFMEGHYMEPISIPAQARMAGLSRSHFHALFRASMGCTPIEHLTRVRIRAAERLLRESDAPVIQIAMDCGFASLSRFYEAFRLLARTTPRRIRNGS